MSSSGEILDWVLIFTGLIVWARLIAHYLYRRPYLKLDAALGTRNSGIGLEHLAPAALIFLVGTMVVYLLCQNVPFVLNADLNRYAHEIVSDLGGKVLAIVFMGIIFYVTDPDKRLFQSAPMVQNRVIKKAPRLLQAAMLSGVIYLATYPVVNALLLNLGVTVIEGFFKVPCPRYHPALLLLASKDASMTVKAMIVLSATIVAATGEELFFRGMLQNWLLRVFRRPWLAIVLTATGFTLVHAPMYSQMPALWALAVILGWSYWRYRSIAVPIFTHLLFNCGTLVLWYLGTT